jgi:hypothetical protein
MTQPTRPLRSQPAAVEPTPTPAPAPSPAPKSTAPPAPRHDDEPDPQALRQWALKAGRPWIGWAFIIVGLLLTLLGWIGVSGEAIVAKQIPYVVSGGIGGVLLAVIGAYFLGTEELRKDSGRLDRLEQKVDELHAALLQRPDAPAVVVDARSGNGSAPESVLVVSGGETFHAHGCPMAAGKDTEELAVAAATKRGLSACPLCAPTAAV